MKPTSEMTPEEIWKELYEWERMDVMRYGKAYDILGQEITVHPCKLYHMEYKQLPIWMQEIVIKEGKEVLDYELGLASLGACSQIQTFEGNSLISNEVLACLPALGIPITTTPGKKQSRLRNLLQTFYEYFRKE